MATYRWRASPVIEPRMRMPSAALLALVLALAPVGPASGLVEHVGNLGFQSIGHGNSLCFE
jgi:hypothetical protein